MSARLGSCGCTCATPACNRRISAVKDWNGWLPFGSDPETELITTRYLTIAVKYEIAFSDNVWFQGQPDWAQIDPTITPGGTDVPASFGFSYPCPSGDYYPAWNTSGGDPVNYRWYPGGGFSRTITASLKRGEQGIPYLPGSRSSWPVVEFVTGPSPDPSSVTIDETGFSTPVYDASCDHPGKYSTTKCCPDSTLSEASDWDTKPLPHDDAWPVHGCANLIKETLDSVGPFVFGGLVSSTVSMSGLRIVNIYEDTTSYAPTVMTLTVTADLSNPYTLAEAMTDADALLANIPLTGGSLTQNRCGRSDVTTGCGGGESVDAAILEDWVCSGGSQEFSVETQADAFSPDLDASVRAQRMWYDTGTSAYVVVTKSAYDCTTGVSVTTTPYTHPDNATNTAGTPSSITKTGMQVFNPPTYPTLGVVTGT